MSAVTTGAPVFNFQTESFNTCPGQAELRPWLMANDDWSSDTARWWAHDSTFPLAAGSITLTVPLTPDRWSDVNGHLGTGVPAAWAAALTHVTQLGVIFSGGCFLGHGVNIVGRETARFALASYEGRPEPRL